MKNKIKHFPVYQNKTETCLNYMESRVLCQIYLFVFETMCRFGILFHDNKHLRIDKALISGHRV